MLAFLLDSARDAIEFASSTRKPLLQCSQRDIQQGTQNKCNLEANISSRLGNRSSPPNLRHAGNDETKGQNATGDRSNTDRKQIRARPCRMVI